MSFEDFEESTELGQPIELYRFSFQGGTYRYTSSADDVVYDSQTWLQAPGLSRSKVEDTGDISKSSLVLTAPEDFAVAKLFEVFPPSDVVQLEVLRVHRPDLTDGVTLWLGRVLGVTWGVGYSQLDCESLFTRLKQPGLRRIYLRNCPHVLYGNECGLSETTFADDVVLNGLSSDGFELSSPQFTAQPDGYYSGGKLRFEVSPGVFERRGIRTHSGSTVRMTHPIAGLLATSTVTVYPGCDRTRDTCVAKFNNLPNYGGFPYIPEKNPFGSSSVY